MISVILPVYNEEKNIIFVIESILNYFKKHNFDFQIIAVNDGSTDNTEKILNEYKKNVVIVSHKKNLGYGATLRSGFKAAEGDLIFFTDSDRQFDIKDINLFLERIKENDFVIGYRKIRADHFIRILYAKIFNFTARIFFGVKVKDVDCAFKLFRNYVIKNMNLISDGALINLEILARAKNKNYKFIELPVNHFSRTGGRQTGGSLKVIFRAIFQFFLLKKILNKSFIHEYFRK